MKKNNFFCKTLQSGQSLIELILVIGLITVLLPALFTGFAAARSGRVQQQQRIAAVSLAREGMEAVRVIREKDWTTFSGYSGPIEYHPYRVGNSWSLISSPETINGFSRKIVINDVFRDSNGNISTSGTLDSSTKKVLVIVSWTTPVSASINITDYLTRYTNLSYTETTSSQFQNGTYSSNIAVKNVSGGEVTLGPGGGSGDWCSPSLTLSTQDLPKNGVANAISAIEGVVFAATGENASGVSFAKVDITTTYPPVPTLQSTYDGFKTNDIFGDSDYAYIATDTNSKEIDIIDLNKVVAGKYQEAGFFNAPGNGNANSVYVFNNIGFMTGGSKLYTFDLSTQQGTPPSSRSGSRPLLGSVDIVGVGSKVVVVQDPSSGIIYAYVASSSISKQIQIFQISSDGKTITQAGFIQLPALGGVDLFVSPDGSRSYVVTGYSSSQDNAFILNTFSKNSISILSSTTTSGMNPTGITVIESRAIIVGHNGTYQYQVFKVDNDTFSNCDSNDATVGKISVASGINGVSSVTQVNGDVYSYIISGDASSELKIIRGGGGSGGGGQYAFSGIYESQTFNAGHDVAFNYFSTNESLPAGTAITYKIAIKNVVAGSCPSFSNSDFVSISAGKIPIPGVGYSNPGQCLKYQANLSTIDPDQTPILYDITFNYSP